MWGPNASYFGFWILGILDFGVWGVWILDSGAGIPNPKSTIQNPKSKLFWPNFLDFGFWILDRYVAILYVRPQRPIFWILAGILDFGSWGYRILDFGFWILDVGDFGCWILGILDFGDFGFGIFGILGVLDFGFWIFGTLCSRSLCAKFGFWNLGILDFGFLGFWILDFGDLGFWILDFGDLGFWILDWGFWIGKLWQNFGCYIRKEDCARRTGSADLLHKDRLLDKWLNRNWWWLVGHFSIC